MKPQSALEPGLFLVLGTGYTEGIDLLGGRVNHAMVVGPALPEVNAVQRAKLAHCGAKSRDAAFRLVYQVPGMQKVNQALGRLVRAPGQRARVLLHCRRFADPSYAALLAPEYRRGWTVAEDAEFTRWLGGDAWPPWWQSLTLMFQLEVAERIVARPGTAAYGRLSVLARWRRGASTPAPF